MSFTIHVRMKKLGKQRPGALTPVPFVLDRKPKTVRQLLTDLVTLGVRDYNARKDEGQLLPFLTREEIAAAEAIIVAADREIEMARFDGKPVLQVPVADGIHKAKELIEKAASGQAPVYRHAGGGDGGASSAGAGDSAGRKVYKHLMNGVSHMLPFVIGGGVLIALAFLFDDYSVNPANFGKNTPLAAYLKTIGEQIMEAVRLHQKLSRLHWMQLRRRKQRLTVLSLLTGRVL